ncbi:syntaxin [Phanerochaete sordida]|uniref:Syntaxin n=1 Tax=Phanerochaete sordida TaxID=48140 RepID=A0A9P3GG93_9APHY|nr:syntaxin [Phanerochaete sordida]
MSTAIKAIYIRSYEERTEPKPHTVYRIEIQATVRSWQMWRRYSEFADLHTELTKSTGAAPPAELPPKHSLSMFRSHNNPTILEERRQGLEQYLRAIVSARDDRWRESFAFRDFLGVPVGKADAAAGGFSQFTSSSWLDEHTDLQARVRDVRADINKRDALADTGDVSGSHQTNVQAKKKLAAALSRVGALEDGLEHLALAGMSEGELQRRRDMVARLRDDCEKLAKMVTVARSTTRGLGAPAERNPATDSDRDALLSHPARPSSAGFSRPVTRVFGGGGKPKETDQTRPLDNQGLVQLQSTQMDQQDAQLAQLSSILQRQKHLGLAINHEIREQNEMLDDLTNEVDHVGGKLTSAKKQMNRLG